MRPSILARDFYDRDTVTVARDLLGKRLVRIVGGVTMSGMICETEAYGHEDDPASHAHRRRTERNSAMFGPTGRAYVYFTYGMHHCFNVVARAPGTTAGAVLIRALMPCQGMDHMIRNRGRDQNIADGPAKLAQALGITREQYGEDLTIYGGIHIEAHGAVVSNSIHAFPRIGVRDARHWNFTLWNRRRAASKGQFCPICAPSPAGAAV